MSDRVEFGNRYVNGNDWVSTGPECVRGRIVAVPLVITIHLTLAPLHAQGLAGPDPEPRQPESSPSEFHQPQELEPNIEEDWAIDPDQTEVDDAPLDVPELADEADREEMSKAPGVEEHSKVLPSGFAGKSGVTPQSLALPDGSGSIQGMGESFTPNLNTGSGTFSVPISLPPGRRGLHPQLGMAYTTGAGDGVLGWGWSMGTPFVSRQTDKGLPLYGPSDRFMYNGGQELVPIDMPADEDWPRHVWDPAEHELTYYRARIEGGYLRFFYNRSLDTWLVQDRTGKHFFYGETAGAKVLTPKGTFQWSISRMTDVRRVLTDGGNDVHYVYERDGGNLYIKDIYWNSYGQQYGELDKYQHNVHFVYESRPDISLSFAMGFRMEQNLRLSRVEVSSHDVTPEGSRELTRVYLFRYQDESASFHSRLSQIQMCGDDWQPDGTGTCMPPLELSYSAIAGVSADGSGSSEWIPGFGYLNEEVRTLKTSPDISAMDDNADLMDVNQDGLPDLLVTLPDYFGSDHAAILNDGLDGLDGAEPVRISNPAGWSLHLQNLNVSVLDMDGAGNADLLHMPYAEKYHFYRLKQNRLEETYYWEETEDIPVNHHIDFTKDAQDIRMVDLNNDHLIDIVRSTGQRMQHFLNLSAFDGYEGQFGRLNENGRPVVGESIDTCLLVRGSVMQFHVGNLQFGDMNGDGLQDLVDLKSGSIAYWPNRGYGQWGNTEQECLAGEYVDDLEIEMAGSPHFSNPDNGGVTIADINGDGLSDLIQFRYEAVDLWLNRGDNTFTERHIIKGTPGTHADFYGKIRFADINGSGTVDLVWTDAGNYQYIDLAGHYRELGGNGGLVPGLLERIENGLGGTTLIEYGVSTELMVDAREQGTPWETVAPMAMTVVRKVTSLDNLGSIGGPDGVYTQEYIYRNPYYDGPEAEFKGFGYGESWDRERDANGDGAMDAALCSTKSVARGEAPLVGRNWFHRGVRPECMEPPPIRDWPTEWGPESVACSAKQHMDNPLLGLTGSSIKSDVYSPCTEKVISATVSQIEVRKLFDSNASHDDRAVYAIIPNQGRSYKYLLDPEYPQGNGVAEIYHAVTLTDVYEGVSAIEGSYTPAAAVGQFHRGDGHAVTNNHGFPDEAHFGGFYLYTDAKPYEYATCDGYSDFFEYSFDPQTWLYQVTETWSTGPGPDNGNAADCPSWLGPDVKFNWTIKTYTPYGELEHTELRYWDVTSDGAGNYTPADSATSYHTEFRQYNVFGQVTKTYNRCTGSTLDTCLAMTRNWYQDEENDADLYSAYIIKEDLVVDNPEVPPFTASATWDTGLAQIVKLIGMDGSEGSVDYDALGRLMQINSGSPETGKLSDCPSPVKQVQYHYDTAPMPFMTTKINGHAQRCSTSFSYDKLAGVGLWERMQTYADSLGRLFATVSPGDKVLGEEAAYPWVLSGYQERNAKGAVIKGCEPVPIDGPPTHPSQIFTLQSKTLNCSFQEFDAYGRPTISYSPSNHPQAVNGYILSQAKYGLDEGHALDHLDITDPCHAGTYSTQRADGLGRTVYAVSRYRPLEQGEVNCEADAPVVEKWTRATYGLGMAVTTEEENGVSISRRQLSDSLGRMRVNLDLNFGRWEYHYNQLGELVQTVNPNGDRADYVYDAAGRLIEEFYNDQLNAQYFYDSYPGDEALGLDGLPLGDWPGDLPSYAVTIGSLVAVKDQTGVSIAASNHGNFSESWRLFYPESRIYHTETLLDHAGRLEYSQDPDGQKSTADYYNDGTVEHTYWDGERIIEKVRGNYLGQTEWVEYADDSKTVTWTGYNPVTHQPIQTVVHQRDPQYAGAPESGGNTLVAFGYEYDPIGKLTGVADWRGRGPNSSVSFGLAINHPSQHVGSAIGTHMPNFPGAEIDTNLPAPGGWNDGTGPNGIIDQLSSDTGWPLGATPSDAVFDYDTQYQLIHEDRKYINNLSGDQEGHDFTRDESGAIGPARVRALDWQFDSRGSMSAWTENWDNNPNPKNLGRALGSTIINGYQLNQQNGCDMNWLATNNSLPAPGSCKIPDALYFAHNLNEVEWGPGQGRGTCVWLEYDQGGRMTFQHIRTGCNSCDIDDNPESTVIDWGEKCPGAPAVSAPGALNYWPEVEAHYTRYEYTWNARNQLVTAKRFVDEAERITMAYVYDSGGGRVVREKSDIVGGGVSSRRQDVYLGSIERRQVDLIDLEDGDASVSIITALENINNGTAQPGRYLFDSVEGTRKVKYAGIRIQQKYNDVSGQFDPAQKFLSFSNHLGSTSAVVDWQTGKLTEWRTHHAYGADESHWKADRDEYDNAEEPYGFTGMEEDDAVGLHYFGARYYSSYIGRWLNPDPPVVHGGGFGNHYTYGGNSPYIYIDPDGNGIHIAIGAIVGAIGGFVSGMVSGKGWKKSLAMAAVGAAVGALAAATGGAALAGLGAVIGAVGLGTGATAALTVAAGVVVGASIGASAAFTQTFANGLIGGASASQAFSSGMSAAGWGAISGAIGGGGGAALGIGNALSQASQTWISAGAGAVLSAQMTATQIAIETDGDLEKANWEEVIKSYAISQAVSVASSVAGSMASGGMLGGAKGGASTGEGDSLDELIMSLPGGRAEYIDSLTEPYPFSAKNPYEPYPFSTKNPYGNVQKSTPATTTPIPTEGKLVYDNRLSIQSADMRRKPPDDMGPKKIVNTKVIEYTRTLKAVPKGKGRTADIQQQPTYRVLERDIVPANWEVRKHTITYQRTQFGSSVFIPNASYQVSQPKIHELQWGPPQQTPMQTEFKTEKGLPEIRW